MGIKGNKEVERAVKKNKRYARNDDNKTTLYKLLLDHHEG